MIQDWHGKRVTVMGLGRFGGGVGVTRWLVRQGAVVLVTDQLPAERLESALDQIRDLDVSLRLGGHDERDFRQADLVVVNPAVPDSSPYLQATRPAGVPLTTEINLFVERCAARCVGVTGSVGKSTVTAMSAHVLQNALEGRRVWLGGNIGRSLLDDVDAIRPADVVVLELSSFQLQRTPAVRWSPHIAVITNLSENHLDWHGSYAAYVAAKFNILRYQQPARDLVVVGDDPELERQLRQSPLGGPRWRYRLDDAAPAAAGADRELRWENVQFDVPGSHNRLNAAAALSVAHLLGVETRRAVEALASFAALPDRLQRVALRDGVTYYNDSKATSPAAALMAMQAVEGPLLIILGGYDKGSDLRGLAGAVAQRVRFAACIGQTGAKLAALIRSAGGRVELCNELDRAVAACQRNAQPGDAVLLSPGCASWGQFDDYRARGAAFTRLVTDSPPSAD